MSRPPSNRRSGLVGGPCRDVCARVRVWRSGSRSRSPRRAAILQDIDETMRLRRPASRIWAAASPSTISAPATPHSATFANLGVDLLKIDGAFVRNLMQIGGRPRLRPYADRPGSAARSQDGRRMGAGRRLGRDLGRMGLRLHARRAGRARIGGAAVGCRGATQGKLLPGSP